MAGKLGPFGTYGKQCAVMLCGLALLPGCDRKTPSRSELVPEVDVARPVVHESVEWDEYTGRLGAVETVEVRARVDGYLEKIHFKAGQIVKKGDVLFTIDRRPYEAALDRARADVKRAQTELEHSEFDLHRIEELRKTVSAAEKEYKDVFFAEHKAQSELERAIAEQRIAALNLEWTQVVAPIAGRISREFVTVGNLIHDGSSAATLLTTIVSLDPIHCYFDVDEQAYLKYARMSRSGERQSSREHANPVRVALLDESEFSHEGHMDFVDNTIDQQTGTLRGRAVLPNPDGILVPGLFVRVRLIGSGVRPMVFVPDAAIATDQTTRMVFVVDDKSVVHRRPIISGVLQNGLRRVTSGLDGSETIVVSGAQRVRPDTPVKPHSVSISFAAWKPVAASASRPASQVAGNIAGGAP
jgi:RND family efflux transporter MFP subunit